MSGAVEFVDPDPEPGPTPQPDGPAPTGHDPRTSSPPTADSPPARAASFVAAVAWLLAAAGCVVGAFRALLTVHVTPPPTTLSLDGWGRGQAQLTVVGSHGPRFGIALCVVAGLFVVAAVLAVAAGFRDGPARATTVTATVAIATLAGAVGSASLFAQSQISAVNQAIALETKDTADTIQGFHHSASVGWFVWWGVVAVALGLAGLAARLPAVLRLVPRFATRQAARREDRRDGRADLQSTVAGDESGADGTDELAR